VKFISALNELIITPMNANILHTPSAIIHSHSLIEKVGLWMEHSPNQNFHPDNEFFARMDKIEPKKMVGSVSVAKVPAGWRKNIYQTRDARPQKALFEQLISHPHLLRDTAITHYVKQFDRITVHTPYYKDYEDYRHFKGLA
jgi:hypothetical protein